MLPSIEELNSFIGDCAARMEALATSLPEERSAFNDAETAELDQLDAWVDEARALVARVEKIERAKQHAGAQVPGFYAPNINTRQSDDPFDLRTIPFNASRGELRGRVDQALERMVEVPDSVRTNTSDLVRRIDNARGDLARHVLSTGSEAYRSGWQKMIAGVPELLNDSERQALADSRAASLTGNAGGYAIPTPLDPTIISTRDQSTNPFRRISTIKTTIVDEWNGVSSAGMTASFDAEAAQVSDDAPTLAQPSITTRKAQAFAPVSIEAAQDWAAIEQELRAMFQEAKDDLEGQKFVNGASGSNEPIGIVTALDGTSSELTPTTGETFALADVYKVLNNLPAKYRTAILDGSVSTNRASWLADLPTYNSIRQFDTNGGAALWTTLGNGTPDRLLGYPTYEASALRSTADINTAATADNFILLLGDFRYYYIVDRVGMSIEYIPHLFGANYRPTGQRGWYAYWRVGADSVNDDAFRVMNVVTAA